MSQDAVCDPLDGSARDHHLLFLAHHRPSVFPQTVGAGSSTPPTHQQPFLEPLEDRAVILPPPGEVALREFLEISGSVGRSLARSGLMKS